MSICSDTLEFCDIKIDLCCYSSYSYGYVLEIILKRKMNFSIQRVFTTIATSRWIFGTRRCFSLTNTVNTKDSAVVVIGHQNPDTDAITAAVAYSDFLRQTQVNARAYRLGELNNETKFVMKMANVEIPEMLPDDLADGTEIALVDHNESKSCTSKRKYEW